jgi:hypothetical protein
MSGRRIDDMGGEPHTSDMAMKSKNKLKHYTSAEGSGHIGMNYHDTTEGIKEDQMHGDGKIKGRPMKPGYRY